MIALRKRPFRFVVSKLGKRVVKATPARLDPLPPEPTPCLSLKLPKNPFRVKFIILEDKAQTAKLPPFIKNVFAEARRRLELHFGEFNSIGPEGLLVSDPEAKGKIVTLRFDFDISENVSYGIKLPPTKVPIKELKSGYSVEQWRLFVITRSKIKNLYAGIIFFREGKFYLQNIREGS